MSGDHFCTSGDMYESDLTSPHIILAASRRLVEAAQQSRGIFVDNSSLSFIITEFLLDNNVNNNSLNVSVSDKNMIISLDLDAWSKWGSDVDWTKLKKSGSDIHSALQLGITPTTRRKPVNLAIKQTEKLDISHRISSIRKVQTKHLASNFSGNFTVNCAQKLNETARLSSTTSEVNGLSEEDLVKWRNWGKEIEWGKVKNTGSSIHMKLQTGKDFNNMNTFSQGKKSIIFTEDKVEQYKQWDIDSRDIDWNKMKNVKNGIKSDILPRERDTVQLEPFFSTKMSRITFRQIISKANSVNKAQSFEKKNDVLVKKSSSKQAFVPQRKTLISLGILVSLFLFRVGNRLS